MNAVTILIQATAIMLALMALRPVLKRFLSARGRCALWAIPALRLLVPLELESSLSVMAPVEPVSEQVEAAVRTPVILDAPAWLGTGIGMQGTENAAQNSAPEVSLGGVLLIVWLAGVLVTGGVILYQNIRFYSRVKRLAEPLGSRGLPVCLVKGLPSPCLAGVVKPRIYVNEQTLVSEEVLAMTLLHEMTHYKRRDHIWGAVRGILLALYWFHPLVWISSELFRCDCETACDAAATRGMDAAQRESYGMALITLASRGGRSDAGRLVCLSTMGGSKKLLKERITQLARGRSFRFAAVISLLLAAVLCCSMCTVPHEGDNETAPPGDEPASGGSAQQNDLAAALHWEPVVVEGYVLSDGSPVSVRVTLEITEVLKGGEAYEALHMQDAAVEPPDADHEYILVNLNVKYDDGGLDELSMGENRASLEEARLYFALSNEENNAVDMTASLENPVYALTLRKGESAAGAVAFLQEKGNTQPLGFAGFGQYVLFLVNGAEQKDATDRTIPDVPADPRS